jgi:hypothetical protein
LDELPGEMITVTATDFWKYRSSQAHQNQYVLDMMTKLVPKAINLKIGAQVMLLRNRIQYQGKISNLVNDLDCNKYEIAIDNIHTWLNL